MTLSAKDSKLRSLVKTMSWRIIATMTTFSLAYLVFRDTPDALEKSTIVAGSEFVIKFLFYYLHERGWQKIPEGTIRKLIKKQ